MVYVRQTIVSDASTALSRVVCIATRYSVVRRQFGANNGGLETQVIDYKTQQARLFPLLASAYAFRFVGEWLKWLYTDVMKRLQAEIAAQIAAFEERAKAAEHEAREAREELRKAEQRRQEDEQRTKELQIQLATLAKSVASIQAESSRCRRHPDYDEDESNDDDDDE